MRVYEFYQDFWEANITYLIGGEFKDLEKFLIKKYGKIPDMWNWDKRYYFDETAHTTDAYQFHVKAPLGYGEMFYVWMATDQVAHENKHLAGDILFNRGVGYCFESEEVFAYFVSWLDRKVRPLVKWKSKKSK